MNTKKKTLSVLTMAATALLFAACDKDEVGRTGRLTYFAGGIGGF